MRHLLPLIGRPGSCVGGAAKQHKGQIAKVILYLRAQGPK